MPDLPDLRTQLAAYLAGELDDAASREVEQRIDGEPWVAREADDMADLLVGLGRVDAVEPPAGYPGRLRDRLAAEIGHELPEARPPSRDTVRAAGAAAADGLVAPARRADARGPAARRSPRRRFAAGLGVAAAIAVLLLASTAVLQGGFLGGADDSDEAAVTDSAGDAGTTTRQAEEDVAELQAEDTAMAPADEDAAVLSEATEEALAAEEGADDAADGAAGGTMAEALPAPTADDAAGSADTTATDDPGEAGDAAQTPAAPAPAPTDTADQAAEEPAAEADSPPGAALEGPEEQAGPAVVDLGEIGPGEDAVREQVGGRSAAQDLLGRPASDGEALADPYRDEILRSPPFTDGTTPGQCIMEVLGEAGRGVVPAVAARFDVDGTPHLGYALVRSSDGQALDRVDVWVVLPDDCALVAVVS